MPCELDGDANRDVPQQSNKVRLCVCESIKHSEVSEKSGTERSDSRLKVEEGAARTSAAEICVSTDVPLPEPASIPPVCRTGLVDTYASFLSTHGAGLIPI